MALKMATMMPLRMPITCSQLLQKFQQQLQKIQLHLQLPQLQNLRVVPFIAQMRNVADKCRHTQGELCALRVCPQTNGVDVAVKVALLLFMQFVQRTSMRGSVLLVVLNHLNMCLVFPLQPQWETAMNVSFLKQTATCIPFCAIRGIESTTVKRVGKHGSAVIATKRSMPRK